MQAFTGDLRFVHRKPPQREVGREVWQVAFSLLLVKRFMRLRRRVEGVPDQQSLLRLAKVQRFFTQGCPVMAGINRLLRMGVAFHHALVEGFATGRGQQELVLELINNKPGEGGEIDGVTARGRDQTRRKFKAVMLGWGK